ncbi:hypothetical protein TIFTF001_008433 [Ficus carica]|uniref:Telomerase reverse transcriptase n=1 Tax=Ficus carica TaxID=3494 RepID=A0AA88DH25_FICCA|nr:hypothetical protein TIFTF001_008433 [Ficus carica]
MEALPEPRSHSLRHLHFLASAAAAAGRCVAPLTGRLVRLPRLTCCFAVVSENAPPLRCLLPPESYCWSQHQIIVRTIEMIISEQSVSSNVISSGYDKCKQWSPLVEHFTSPAWCLLLERVGEEIMAYLLKHTLIFMPLGHKNYPQVAGYPINKLCSEMLDHSSKPRSPSYLLIPGGPKKRRERDESILPVSKRQHFASSFCANGISCSLTCFSSHHEEKHRQMNLSEAALEIKVNSVINTKENSSVIQNLNQSTPKLRKRSRPFSWQCHRKRRQLDSQETAVPTSCTSIPTHKNSLPEKCGLKENEVFMGNCWVRQVPRKVTKGAQINILKSLKPNSSDSMLLLESIFGLSDVMKRSNTLPCFENNGFGLSGSASVCPYHSLIKYLKILICRTRRCEHLRLLNKHCVVPTLDQNARNSECSHKKSVWEMVKKRAATCLKDQNNIYLDNAEARDIVMCRSFGFSKLRLLPKENGIRLLANLKASSRMLRKESYCKSEFSGMHKRTDSVKKSVDFHHFRSVNSVLRDTRAVLKGMQLKEPEKLGSSVFDYNDVYRRLCPFLVGLKRGSSTMPAVFMIVSDVSKAFDSVDQNRLLSVVEDVIRDERYTLQLSCQVFCTKKSLSVHENLALLDQNINSRNKSFISRRSPDSILVHQECSKSVKKEGLLFHLIEHEVFCLLSFAHYTMEIWTERYLNDHLCLSLTVCWQGKPARHLEAKLCGYMRPKCHPIFYDSNINSAGVVRLNIFQAFLLCAMKFHCHVCDLSYICKFRTRSYLSIIERSFRYMHFLKEKDRFASLGYDLHPILHLEDGEVEWLGLNAYIQVLKRKQSRHKELLSLLRSKLSAHRLSRKGSTHLNYAVDTSHSSLTWKIKH